MVLAAGGIEIAPAGQEVVVDEADDVEAVGDDEGVREMFADQRAVGGGEVHADQFDLGFALQALEVGPQSGFRASQDDVVDLVAAQVAQSRGEALAAGEEMFVDTEHGRAAWRVALAELPFQAGLEVPLDGGCADAFAAGHEAAVDAVEVESEDLTLDGFAGALPGQDAGEALAEAAAALKALEFAGFLLDDNMPQPPILVAQGAVAAALAAQPDAVTVGAG